MELFNPLQCWFAFEKFNFPFSMLLAVDLYTKKWAQRSMEIDLNLEMIIRACKITLRMFQGSHRTKIVGMGYTNTISQPIPVFFCFFLYNFFFIGVVSLKSLAFNKALMVNREHWPLPITNHFADVFLIRETIIFNTNGMTGEGSKFKWNFCFW